MRCSSDQERLDTDEGTDNLVSPPTDDLTAVVDLQGSSGVFKWGPALERILGMSQSDLNAKKPSEVETTEEVWLTLVMVALLETKMAEKKELWELVADKAIKFAKKQLGGDEEKLGKIREAAKMILII